MGANNMLKVNVTMRETTFVPMSHDIDFLKVDVQKCSSKTNSIAAKQSYQSCLRLLNYAARSKAKVITADFNREISSVQFIFCFKTQRMSEKFLTLLEETPINGVILQ